MLGSKSVGSQAAFSPLLFVLDSLASSLAEHQLPHVLLACPTILTPSYEVVLPWRCVVWVGGGDMGNGMLCGSFVLCSSAGLVTGVV